MLAVGVFIHGNVFASVENHTDNGVNYEMSYPIVYTNNKAAQDRINQDIYHYIAAFRDDFNAGKFYKGWFSYKVRLENNEYVSLTIKDMRYNMGAAHANHVVYGLVYDKNTGRRLPLSHFLKITVNDLRYFYGGHLYSEGGEKIENLNWSAPERVPEDYFLLGNGGVALIYGVNELYSSSSGATTIRLNREEVEYFNRKNR